MSQAICLTNGLIIDPANGREEIGDIRILDGKIIGSEDAGATDFVTYDLNGMWVVPGLVDMHVHLREPGEEYKETIGSGCRAAAAGGFTAVACMPNTKPPNDCEAVTKFIIETAEDKDARVYPVAAISKGQKGRSLAEYGELKQAGAVAVTDDGLPVIDSQLMRRAMEYASGFNLPVMSHSEEMSMSAAGCMNEGEVSTRLGLKGIPTAAEAIMVYREAALAALTGHHVHISHVSAKDSVAIIREFKKQGIKITAETTPHYFTLTDKAVEGYNTNAKMNPPLRSEEDRLAIREGLQDGTFDAIATDHAPHSVMEKDLEFDRAAYGIIGLESALSLSLALVREGLITKNRLVELMSVNPVNILGVQGGSLGVGDVADITVIDPEARFEFTKEMIRSKSKNSPFLGMTMQGRAALTLLEGRITHNLL